MPEALSWPRISIVTPTLNYGDFIEQTIRSVLDQGYPNLEYIVVDGGSTDNTVEILRKYDRWIDHWVSRPDGGPAQALNYGFGQCTGDLFGWINSDDMLLPNALQQLALAASQCPNDILAGNVLIRDEVRRYQWELAQRNIALDKFSQPWRYSVTWHQPGVYFPRELYFQVGGIDESLSFVFDWDLMCRCKALGFWTLIWRMVRPPWTTPAGSSGAPGLASDSCVARGAISRCRLS